MAFVATASCLLRQGQAPAARSAELRAEQARPSEARAAALGSLRYSGEVQLHAESEGVWQGQGRLQAATEAAPHTLAGAACVVKACRRYRRSAHCQHAGASADDTPGFAEPIVRSGIGGSNTVARSGTGTGAYAGSCDAGIGSNSTSLLRAGSGYAARSGFCYGAIALSDILGITGTIGIMDSSWFGSSGTRVGAWRGAGTAARSGACSGATGTSGTLGISGILWSIVVD